MILINAKHKSRKSVEEFEGIIASVTRFGMFIELENTIEGLVHISELEHRRLEKVEDSVNLKIVQVKADIINKNQIIQIK